ncbi:MAG TPA: CDP-alcohol phosphatidyltransferase family protein [Tepidisphaeraceae bacterium]|jgi:CDP-diacylglycerol--serine O-phosphatidyltransferase
MKTQWTEIDSLEHRRLRRKRRGRKAYLRSIYSLPSLATLGNAICGFGAIYVASMPIGAIRHMPIYFAGDPSDPFLIAAYLIFLAMGFDALDGRLARFTRHTTDFGGQLDSLADAVSFGAAPAFLALELFKHDGPALPDILARLVWAIGALYLSCALLRLARFNVSNQHGEQHHFSFLGLPSPAAAALIASFVLMERDLHLNDWHILNQLGDLCALIFPALLLAGALLMVSNVRYPHLVNRYLRGKRSLGRILSVLIILLLIVVAHRYVIALGVTIYVLYGLFSSARYLRRASHG